MTAEEIKASAKAAIHKATLRRQIENLEQGADAAVRVGAWVRTLAAEEAKAGGVFTDALDLKPEAATWGSLAREIFGSLYGLGTEAVEAEKAPEGAGWVRELLGQAESLPEWQELQARAAGDAWASGLAAAGAMEALAPLAQDLPKNDAQELKEQIDALQELIAESGKRPGARTARRLTNLRKEHQRAVKDDANATALLRSKAAKVRSVMRGAAAAATAAIDEQRAAEEGLGIAPGQSQGLAMRVQGATAAAREVLRTNTQLRKIAVLAGRFRRRAAQKQAEKARGGAHEVADVTTGADLARLLPSEAVLAGDEDGEAVLFRRLTERAAMNYELRSPETKTEGPIVICIDESGSMRGERDVWAKAACLAILEIAARQNRAFAILHFDDGVTRTDVFRAPRSVRWEAIAECLTWFSGGGTDISDAMAAGIDLIAKEPAYRKADLVVITDGEDYSDSIRDAVKAAKAKGISTHWVGIDCDDTESDFGLATVAVVTTAAIKGQDVKAIDGVLGAI